MTMENFGAFNIAEGEIRSIWSQANSITIQESAPVFQLHFKVLQDGGVLSDALYLDETALRSIAYNSNMQESEVQLAFLESTSTNTPSQPSNPTLTVSPNPFSEQTVIGFSLPATLEAHIDIFDAAGRQVCMLQSSAMPTGAYTLIWDGKSTGGQELPAGIYLIRLIAGDDVLTKKVQIIR